MKHSQLFSFGALALLCAFTLSAHAEPNTSLENPERIQLKKMELQVPAADYVPYAGASAAVRQAFAKGFVPAVGSGLAFQGKAADGSLTFLSITDRGPNGDGPKVQRGDKTFDSKIFSTPDFSPAIATITVKNDQARVTALRPIRSGDGTAITGLPIAQGVGSSGEIALDDNLRPLRYDANGMDTESIVIDGKNTLWISDEYGPFIAKLDAKTGKILKKYAPGTQPTDLPIILSKRRPNRGMEGLALDRSSGLIHGFLQSPLSGGKVDLAGKSESVHNYAPFVRWLTFNPKTESSKLYAYPLNAADYKGGKTGNAKLGDLVALGQNRFITIEQGSGADGKVFNWLMLVEIPQNASDITTAGVELEKSSILQKPVDGADYSRIVPLKKTLLLNLNQLDWSAEKAEGLALVDNQTLALVNDNDFGLRTAVFDNSGKEIKADITECTANEQGASQGDCVDKKVQVVPAKAADLAQNFWLIRFPKALNQYTVR